MKVNFRVTAILPAISTVIFAQGVCPGIHFLSATTVNLQPSSNSHINIVRQSDGSHTGYEVGNAAPYRVIRTTPHFEQQLAACGPHIISRSTSAAPVENPPGAVSQTQVAMTLPSGGYFSAWLDGPILRGSTMHFDVFDRQNSLQTETNIPLPNPGAQTFLALKLADIDGDGKLDLIAFSTTGIGHGYDNLTLWIFRGNGDGTFQPATQQDLGIVFGLAWIAFGVGDVNGDGKADILAAAEQIGPPGMELLGNGDGTFRKSSLNLGNFQANYQPSIALGDLNGDGKVDLVFTTMGTGVNLAVEVELGNGDGSFQAASQFPIKAAPNGVSPTVAIGDVNGDAIPDVITASGTLLFGDGKGGFPSRRDYVLNAGGTAMLADWDGDGIADIVVGSGNPSVLSGIAAPSTTVLFGEGGGRFAGATVTPASVAGSDATGQTLVSADFDNDGIPDLVLADRTAAAVTVLKGKGNGEFETTYTASTQSVGGYPVSLALGDFDHDGRQDIAVLLDVPFGTGEAEILFGKGDGTFTAPLVLTVPGAFLSFIGTADFNGDGIPDLVVSSKNSVTILLAKTGGTFAPPASYSVQGGYLESGYAITAAMGDFNRDGKVDIAVPGQAAGQINILLGKGDGTFSAGPPIPLSFPPATGGGSSRGPVNLAAADFNGDGRMDLAATIGDRQNLSAAPVAVLLGNGDGTFQSPLSGAAAATGIAAADLNGDKAPDLIVTGGFGMAVLQGNGDGTFQSPLPITPYPLQSIATADWNGDGKIDVAGGLLSIGVATFLNLTAVPPALTVVSAATFLPNGLTANSFASAFGRNLVDPKGSATVTVTDAAGVTRAASTFYISASQINFLIPAATATGNATVTVSSNTGSFAAQIEIVRTSPALFTVDGGTAAAYVTTVATDGSQSSRYVFIVANGAIAPLPIEFSPGSQSYLILFGTGFESASAVSATVQGMTVPVVYAGPQSEVPGLDQVNLLLPLSLAGSGLSSVVVTADGVASNTGYVTIH